MDHVSTKHSAQTWLVDQAATLQPLLVDLVRPEPDVVVLRVGTGADPWLPVARATAEGERWRVRSLLAHHEAVVGDLRAARQCLFGDLHEAFPGLSALRLPEHNPFGDTRGCRGRDR